MAKSFLHTCKQYDMLGIAASVACIIHCLAPPVALGILALAGTASEHALHDHVHEEYHLWVHFLFIALAWVSVFYSNKMPGKDWVKPAMYLCVAGFSVFVLLHEYWEPAITVSLSFSIGLVGLHGYKLINQFSKRKSF